LALALRDVRSPYRHALDAVSATLPRLRGDEQEAVRRLVVQGPPDEEVGLEPFAPPDLMGARR
jgi:nitrate reductase delta subunit